MDKKTVVWLLVLGAIFLFIGNFIPGAFDGKTATQATPAKPEIVSFDQVQKDMAKDPASITKITFVKDRFGQVQEVVVERKDKSLAKAEVPGEAGTTALLAAAKDAGVETAAEKGPDAQPPSAGTSLVNTLIGLLPMILIIGIMIWIFRGMARGGAQMRDQLANSKANQVLPAADKKTFKDVAGCDEAKQELMEVVNYLKNPGLLATLGGKPPKGVLLIGGPGNGKTLLAKAVAGEAGAAFFAISASQFVEMFVGVGAARVRDLFDKARKHKPAIVFIDEIDAVGRQRGAGVGGGNDEREQTLNQLLVEMDGFTTNDGLILMAATNRPDVLDPALIRPGRFDLQVLVDSPDRTGRVDILKIHTRGKKMAKDVDLEVLATNTPGFSGAELEGLCNQAAIVAARRILAKIAELRKTGKYSEQEIAKMVPMEISMADMDEGIDRVQMGPAKENAAKRMDKNDMLNTAVHEIGHAWISQVMHDLGKGGDPVTKITIVPRARALGYTQALPKGDRYNYTRENLLSRIKMAMGGRAAQEVMLNTVDTGASNDFKQAKQWAYRMVTEFGMDEELGPIQVGEGGPNPFLGRSMASNDGMGPELANKIDAAWRKIVNDCYREAKEIIERDKDCIQKIVDVIMVKETILGPEWLALRAQSNCAIKPGCECHTEEAVTTTDGAAATVEAAPAVTGDNTVAPKGDGSESGH